MEIYEIEALFTSEELSKSDKMVQALLHHANIYLHPKSTAEQKEQALKAMKIGHAGSKAIAKKPKAPKEEAAPKPKITPKYHSLYQHYNVSPETWEKLSPEHKMKTFEYHNEVMGGKHPDMAHVQAAAKQQVKKSLDNFIESLRAVKEELQKSNYGPKGMKAYNLADNIKRKTSRTGDIAGAGPNTAVRSFSTKPGQLSAKQAAAKEDKKKKKLSGPVKVYTPEEIQALEAKRKLGKP